MLRSEWTVIVWVLALACVFAGCGGGGSGSGRRAPTGDDDSDDDADDDSSAADDADSEDRIPCEDLYECPTETFEIGACEYVCNEQAADDFSVCKIYSCLSLNETLFRARACCGGFCLTHEEILERTGCL